MPAPSTTAFPIAALTVLVTLAAVACDVSPSARPSAHPSARESSVVSVPRAPGASVAPGGPAAPVAPGAAGAPSAPVAAGKAQCRGWPDAPAGRVPRPFQPASVLRCVIGTVSVPGKGRWTAAILQKADQGLAPLTGALSSASGHMEPGHMCPQFVIVPPQIVLVSKDGTMIRPSFPVTACGQIQQKVVSALEGLHWQTVSRHLIGKV